MDLINQIRTSQRITKWDIKPTDFVLFICFVLTGAFFLTAAFAGAYGLISGEEYSEESLPFVIASGFGFQLGAVLAWVLFRSVVPYQNLDQPRNTLSSIKIGTVGFLCAYIALIPIMLAWKKLLEALNFEYEFQLPVLLVQEGGSFIEMGLMATLIVVIAPVCEELVYRGFLYRYLNNRLSFGWAIAIPSALFALMHQNLYSFAPLFVLGVALCVVYRLSGNIVSSITLHSLFNLINLLLIQMGGPLEP